MPTIPMGNVSNLENCSYSTVTCFLFIIQLLIGAIFSSMSQHRFVVFLLHSQHVVNSFSIDKCMFTLVQGGKKKTQKLEVKVKNQWEILTVLSFAPYAISIPFYGKFTSLSREAIQPNRPSHSMINYGKLHYIVLWILS